MMCDGAVIPPWLASVFVSWARQARDEIGCARIRSYFCTKFVPNYCRRNLTSQPHHDADPLSPQTTETGPDVATVDLLLQ